MNSQVPEGSLQEASQPGSPTPAPTRTASKWPRLSDLVKVVVLWLAAFAISLPLFWVLHQRGAQIVETIKERDPRFNRFRAEAYYARGKLLYMEGNYDEAAFYLDRAYKVEPSLADARYYLGLIYKSKQDIPAAIGEFEATLQKDSNHFAARFELAQLLKQQGKTFPAQQAFLTLEDILPPDAPEREEYELRRHLVQLSQEILEQDPQNPQSLLVLARSAAERQDWAEAQEQYQRILELYPGNQAALWGLVEIAQQQDNSLQAVDRLAELVRKFPRWVSFYDQLQGEIEKSGMEAAESSALLFRQLDTLRPDARVSGARRSEMQLSGFDLLPRPTLYLNLFSVQLHWTLDRGLIWESERVRPIYRIQKDLYARQDRLFELVETNLIPNPGFECSQPGRAFPAEWPSEYMSGRSLSEGWLQTIQENLPSQKINRYVRLDVTGLNPPGQVALASERFEVKAGKTYLLGARIRNRSGNPGITVRWHAIEEKSVRAKRYEFRPTTTDWEFHYLILKSHADSYWCNLVIGNFAEQGAVDFDDLFFIPLEGVE